MSSKYFILLVLLWSGGAVAKKEPKKQCPTIPGRCQNCQRKLNQSVSRFFSKEDASFSESEQLCKEIGAMPAPFRSEVDKSAIQESIRKISLTPDNNIYSSLYIGLHDVSSFLNEPANYEWKINGQKRSNFTYWKKGEPNRVALSDGTSEKCVAVLLNEELYWLDVTCEPEPNFKYGIHGVVCAKEAQIPDPICQDNSWTISNSANEAERLCFKFVHKDGLSFNEGKQLCDSIGAKPVPYRNAAEKSAIQESLRKTNLKSSSDPYPSIYIGLQDVAPSKSVPAKYEWKINGVKLSDTAYWNKGEPTRTAFPGGSYEKCITALLNEDLR